jgi:hypothetical protein
MPYPGIFELTEPNQSTTREICQHIACRVVTVHAITTDLSGKKKGTGKNK